jgi:hypothetical protein
MSVLKTNLSVAAAAGETQARLDTQRLGENLPPNGPAAAAFLASGVGSAVLGLAIVLVEASPHHFKKWLSFYDPVGPLSGKTILAVAAFALTWIIAGLMFKGRNVRLSLWLTISFVLIGFGLLFTFPLVYGLFTVKP